MKSWAERGGQPGAVIKMTPAKIAQAKALLRKKGWNAKRVAKKLKLSTSSLYGHGLSKRKVAPKRK